MSLALSANESSKARTPIFWPGELPEHWQVKRLKFVVKLVNQKAVYEDSGLPYMGLEHIEPWTGRYIEDEEASADGLVSFFEPGDVLLGKLRPYLAKVHLAKHRGVCSTEALVLRTSADLIPEYLRYFLVAPTTIGNINSSTYGSKMPRASWDFIGNQLQPLPPLDEQRAIADFLDRKTAEIDILIAKKRRLLDLLAEKRTALITRAVTKGLNPDAPMKDSGIEWLGEIPAHWDVLAIKQVFDFQNNRRIPIAAAERRSLERTYPYYGASGIIDYVDDYIFDEDLMLVAEDGANLLSRSTPLAFVARGKYWVNNHAHILRNRFGLLDYWEMLLSVCDFTPFITGSAQPKLTKDRLGAIAIPCPPEKEQSDILKFLGPSFERDELARVLCKKAIERLEEYRSALITNAVTGQIKVA